MCSRLSVTDASIAVRGALAQILLLELHPGSAESASAPRATPRARHHGLSSRLTLHHDTDVDPLGDLGATYAAVREIGRGGMGAVILARHRTTGHLVAIKIAFTSSLDAEQVARFALEGRLMAGFRHPNIVRFYDVRPIGGGRVAIVMEYVEGTSLARIVRDRGPLPFDACFRVLRNVGSALAYAHAQGVIHRDVKPHNVIIDTKSGCAKLSDFGIAKLTSGDGESTQTGVAMGTPTYMSPEQIDGRPLDRRGDIYSFGVLGWEMISGERAWGADSLYHVLHRQKHENLPPLSLLRPDTPNALLLALEGALEKDPALRWAQAEDMIEQLASDAPTTEMLARHRRAAALLPKGRAVATKDAATVPLSRRDRRSELDTVRLEPASAPGTAPNESGTDVMQAESDNVPTPPGALAPTLLRPQWRWLVHVAGGVVVGSIMTAVAAGLHANVRNSESSVENARAAKPTTRGPGPAALSPTRARSDSRRRAEVAEKRIGREEKRISAQAPTRAKTVAPVRRPVRAPNVAPIVADRTHRVPLLPSHGDAASPAIVMLDSPGLALALAEQARTLLSAGKYKDARGVVDSALALDRMNGLAYVLRARLRVREKRVRDAWADLEIGANSGAQWEALAWATVLRVQQDGPPEAREHLAVLLRDALLPERGLIAELAAGLAAAMVAMHDTSAALTLLERAHA